MNRSAIACGLAFACAWSINATADVEVEARNLPACASRDQLRARIAELTPSNNGAEVDARVVFTREGLRVRTRIEMRAPTRGERELVTADCASALEGASLVIAMSVRGTGPNEPNPAERGEPTAAPSPTTNPPAPTPQTAPPPTATSVSAPMPPPSAPSAPSEGNIANTRSGTVRMVAGLVGSGLVGTLPEPTVGGGAFVGARAGAVRVEVQAGLHASQRAEARPGAGGDFSLLSAAARGCFDFVRTSVGLGPCVGLELDRLSGQGFGASGSTSSDVAMLFGPTAGVLLGVSVASWVGIRALAEGMAPIARQTFVIGNVGTVHRPSPVAGRIEIGPEVRF